MEVTAKQRGYYGGGIKEAGETFSIEKKEHLGSWMQPGVELKKLINAARNTASTNDQTLQSGFASARTGGGKFLVKDAAGNVAGSFVGTKAEADAEADRLNAGGEPTNAQAPQHQGAETGAGNADGGGEGVGDGNTGGGEGGGGNGLPDA